MLSKKSLRILGVMTGTSCDGLDAACVEFSGTKLKVLWQSSAPYPRNLSRLVHQAQIPGSRFPISHWLNLHGKLGDWYATVLKRMTSRPQGQIPDVIANHGQTIAHFPEIGMTLQIGEPGRIAAATGKTVVSNFRDGDLAIGGQGAPLVPIFHRMLLERNRLRNTALHNIGGISNLTYVGPKDLTLAFDTGPGNAWLDAAVQETSGGKFKFDKDGQISKKGKVDHAGVREILKDPFFKAPPPKSTGRDQFPYSKFKKETRARGADLVATALEVTVESIARAYQKEILSKGLPLDTIYICGGGAKNPGILEGLRKKLPTVNIQTIAQLGLDSQYIEAQAFACLGYLSLQGKPLGGEWTGAQDFGPPGHIIPGRNWNQVLAKISSSR